MIVFYKKTTVSCMMLFLFVLFLSGYEQAHAGSDVQPGYAKESITAKEQAIVNSYQRECASLRVGLNDLASDLQDISALELKQNMPSSRGALLSEKLADIDRGLSASCDNKKNLDISLNEFATAVARFEHALDRTLTTQPNKTSTDRSLMDSYHEIARKLSRLSDDMNKLLSIAPDYKTIVDTAQ